MRWVVKVTPRLLYPRQRLSTQSKGGWEDHGVRLEGCEKSRLHRDLIPGPSIPLRAAVSNRCPVPLILMCNEEKCFALKTRVSASTTFVFMP
jgi:hypothetical protein